MGGRVGGVGLGGGVRVYVYENEELKFFGKIHKKKIGGGGVGRQGSGGGSGW